MKRSLLLFAVFLTLVVSPVARAETVPLTEQYIASIRSGCTDALQGILRVQKSDAVSRVNRGREYESILRLVAALNSRVVLNNQEAPTLTSTAARMQLKFTTFRDHYLEYAEKVDTTLSVNCKTAPVTFYDDLTLAREARARVAVDIKELDTLLSEYQKGFDELKIQVAKSATENAE